MWLVSLFCCAFVWVCYLKDMETTTNQIKELATKAALSARENGKDEFEAALAAIREALPVSAGTLDDYSARMAYRVCEELEAR